MIVAPAAPTASQTIHLARDLSHCASGSRVAPHVGSSARSARSAHAASAVTCGAASVASALRRRQRRWRKRGRQRCGTAVRLLGLPDNFDTLPPDEQARAALLDRQGLRMSGDFSEEEKKKLAEEMDFLAPYRNLVYAFAALLIVAALQDSLFLGLNVARGLVQADGDRLGLIAFLAVAGFSLLFVGGVLMAPQEVPTIDEVVEMVEKREDDKRKAQEQLEQEVERDLIGTWCYGKEDAQTYQIRYDANGTLGYSERLPDGSTYSAALQPKGRWLWGNMVDGNGKAAGLLRVRRGDEQGSAVSSVAPPGAQKWRNRVVAKRRVAS